MESTAASVSDPVDAYARYGPALLRKAERVLHNRDDAMDVVHNLFVDLLAKPSRDLELSYLYRAVTNRCLNWIRDRNNRSRLLLDRDHDLRGPSRTTIDGLVVDLDLLSRLAARLDRKSQEIVVYHYFDDLSQDEVASLMGMSRRAVVKRLAKIRDKARSVAGEHVAETSS